MHLFLELVFVGCQEVYQRRNLVRIVFFVFTHYVFVSVALRFIQGPHLFPFAINEHFECFGVFIDTRRMPRQSL